MAAVEDGLLLAAVLTHPAGVMLSSAACATCDGPGLSRVEARVERLNQALAAAHQPGRLAVAPDPGPWPESFDGQGGAPARRELLTSLAPVLAFLGRSAGQVWGALGRGEGGPVPGLDRGAEIHVAADACDGCGLCERICPTEALHWEGGELRYSPEACRSCGLCAELCPHHALSLVGPAPLAAFATTWHSLGRAEHRCSHCGGVHPARQACTPKPRTFLEIWPS